jgi:hypothetical protein
MVGLALPSGAKSGAIGHNVDVAQAEAPRFQKVIWYKEPHLRKLYGLSIFLLIASATTGYDGMLVNTSQQIKRWEEFFPEVENENKLGILINMFNIGSIISFFIVPYTADTLGRKPTIMIGCVIMVLGAFLSAFANAYGSKSRFRRGQRSLERMQRTSITSSKGGQKYKRQRQR